MSQAGSTLMPPQPQDKGAETPALQAPDLCGHACPQCLPGAVAQHPTLKALISSGTRTRHRGQRRQMQTRDIRDGAHITIERDTAGKGRSSLSVGLQETWFKRKNQDAGPWYKKQGERDTIQPKKKKRERETKSHHLQQHGWNQRANR